MPNMDIYAKGYGGETDIVNWFGIQSPIFISIVLAVYFLIILKIGPDYMKSRKAYELKQFIIVYNIFQVASCLYIAHLVLRINASKLFQFWLCCVYLPNSPEESIFNKVAYFAFWLKIIELSETVVFVARKKQNQVSFLHLFHHSSMVLLAYVAINDHRGGAHIFPMFLNSIVHIIMYTYYLAAAVLDKGIIRKLIPVKKSITTMQMVQFTLILLQPLVHIIRGCQISMRLISLYIFIVSTIFYMFYDFYQKTYVHQTKNIQSAELKKQGKQSKVH